MFTNCCLFTIKLVLEKSYVTVECKQPGAYSGICRGAGAYILISVQGREAQHLLGPLEIIDFTDNGRLSPHSPPMNTPLQTTPILSVLYLNSVKLEKMGETDLYPCVPLEMSADRLDDLVDKAKTYALMHGNYFSFSFVKGGV